MTNQIFTSIDNAKEYIESQFGKDGSFDVCIKEVYVRSLPVLLVYVSGLVDSNTLTIQLTPLLFEREYDQKIELNDHVDDEDAYFDEHFNFFGKSEPTDKESFLLGVLGGTVGIVTLHGYAYNLELRNYPGRTPEEPDNEKVIRGSRDGFAENIIINAGLIRRRIRSPQLRFELHQLSDLGQTDVAIVYMNDIVNENNLAWIRKRFEQIKQDGLTMADKQLEELLFKQKFNPMPFVRYSERPDIIAAHLLEGHIAIVVDTSPSVIIVPITIFHLLQHAEEFRQASFIGTGTRLLRYLAAFFSLTLLPIWYLLATHDNHLPEALSFIGAKEDSHIPLFLQIIIASLGIEYLRIAAIHTPTPLSTAMGLVAGVIIGQIAIEVGLFSNEVVLYTAVVAIFSFAIPTYELSAALKYFQFFIIILTALWGANGFFIAAFLTFSYICHLRPMNIPYMWPLVPFFPNAFSRVFIRFPMADDALRPYIVGAKYRKRS
nr:spore germination protein [Lysinibacillus timonensis]